MKNDVSHHGILLNLSFAQFCRIFLEKTGFRIRKAVYPIQKFICVKTYLGQGDYYLKFSAKLVKKHPKIRIFPDFQKIRIPDPEFFLAQNHLVTKTELTKKGLAKLVQTGDKQTRTHANIVLLYNREIDVCSLYCFLVMQNIETFKPFVFLE